MTSAGGTPCDTFHDLAVQTHDIVDLGYTTRLGVLEETLTDINLLSVKLRHPEHVLVKKFSRQEEGTTTGADWIWTIGEPGRWLTLLVQAKIVKPETRRCQSLYYRDGAQLRLLKGYARRHGMVPIYCVYNSVPREFGLSLRPPCVGDAFDFREYGCALLTAAQVTTGRYQGQKRILDDAYPWSTLFCCPDLYGGDLGRGAAQTLSNLRVDAQAGRTLVGVDRSAENGPRSPDDLEDQAEDQPDPEGPEVEVDPEAERVRLEAQQDDEYDPDPREMISSELPSVVSEAFRGSDMTASVPVSQIMVFSRVPVRELNLQSGALVG